jgi:hypothetical protein
MNDGRGLAVGPEEDDFFLKFHFEYRLYDGEHGQDPHEAVESIFAASHLIVGEGGGCDHGRGLNMTKYASRLGKILMAPSGPSDFYSLDSLSIFGIHVPSESYSVNAIAHFAALGAKTAAILYYGSGEQVRRTVERDRGYIVKDGLTTV